MVNTDVAEELAKRGYSELKNANNKDLGTIGDNLALAKATDRLFWESAKKGAPTLTVGTINFNASQIHAIANAPIEAREEIYLRALHGKNTATNEIAIIGSIAKQYRTEDKSDPSMPDYQKGVNGAQSDGLSPAAKEELNKVKASINKLMPHTVAGVGAVVANSHHVETHPVAKLVILEVYTGSVMGSSLGVAIPPVSSDLQSLPQKSEGHAVKSVAALHAQHADDVGIVTHTNHAIGQLPKLPAGVFQTTKHNGEQSRVKAAATVSSVTDGMAEAAAAVVIMPPLGEVKLKPILAAGLPQIDTAEKVKTATSTLQTKVTPTHENEQHKAPPHKAPTSKTPTRQ